MSLAFCKIRLRREIMSHSEASKKLLSIRNHGWSKERQELESQLREDALFQSRMEELRQSILPRLEEILSELLRCRRPIHLPNEGRAQLAINILCEEILSKKLEGAQHFVVYVYEDQETADLQQFIHWQKSKMERAQQESSMHNVALREKVDNLKAELADCQNKSKDRGIHDRRQITQLQQDLRKTEDLEKQHLTALNAGQVELERVRSELQRVLNKSKEGESEVSSFASGVVEHLRHMTASKKRRQKLSWLASART